MKSFVDISIIIVNYNTKKLTIDAISSVLCSNTSYTYEILVVDNASSDGSVEAIRQQHSEVKIIANDHNVGFSKANNQAIKIATGRYILLLNSDTIVHEATLQIMTKLMDEQPKIGASGCKVLLPNGELDKACKRGFPTPSASFFYISKLTKLFPTNPSINRYHMGHIQPDQASSIDCLVGAFMMVRKETIDRVGLLDETFFMYGEDIDWCYRIKEAGWDIYYYPKTHIIHYKGASSRKKPKKIVYEFHRAMYIFHKKHYEKKYSFLVNWLVYGGIGLKLGLALATNSLKNKR
ncbi:glycosyltransferase family 2 protein [Bacillus sp. HMF5848]|uniref:glycosyltransferase family 2 protein n=1 Tax=Bacillus sp. HMF5848 TaxID=2495421 RepID=UPI000F768313|nr:glycosyltransferase family 2 protein [Bacillus sp. HMF5848]RSK28664.1 glycosyltransferase family 2 protein [Bacillus sp. HMF5848]